MEKKTDLQIVVLAAGKGTRFKSDTPKVLQLLAGVPLLSHVLKTAATLCSQKIVLVGNEALFAKLGTIPQVEFALQNTPLGTADAVKCALPYLNPNGRVLILYGDVPLVLSETLRQFIATIAHNAVGVLAFKPVDPTGFGRLIFQPVTKKLVAICEERDLLPEQKSLNIVNSGILLCPYTVLSQINTISANNAQKEFYLTDLVARSHAEGVSVVAFVADDPTELMGVNNAMELARAERAFQWRAGIALMQQGVRIADPARLEIRGTVNAAKDVTLDVGVILEGEVTLGARVKVGPYVYLKDVSVADGAEILSHSVLEGATVAREARVGPFARVRPGSIIGEGARVGNFVELKNTTLDDGSKVNHLSYIGDTQVGMNVNIGAGVITCNYDGERKYHTLIEKGAFIGSGCQLVAPVKVEEGAIVGAGTVLTKTAPAGQLTVSRAPQISRHWKNRAKSDIIPPKTSHE